MTNGLFFNTKRQVDIKLCEEGEKTRGALRVDHKDAQMDNIIIGAMYIAAVKWPSLVPPAS